MHNEGYEVIRVDFDSLEKQTKKRVCIFVSEEGKTAQQKVDEFIKGKRVTLYLGSDGNIYPRHEVERVVLK